MKTIVSIMCFIVVFASTVFALSNEDMKAELRKRMDIIETAGRNKAYKQLNKESKELQDFIINNWDKAVPVLIDMITDENEKHLYKWNAIARLRVLKVKEAREAFTKYLSDKGCNQGMLIIASAEALGSLGDEKSIKHLINYYEGFLKGTNKGCDRSHVIKELAKFERDDVIELFLKALSDRGAVVRWRAVRALGEWKVKKAVVPIKKLLETETDFEAKMAAKKSLEQITADKKE